MPSQFELSEKGKDKVAEDRMKRATITQILAGEIEQYFESKGGEFSGINENGINFKFSEESFQNLLDKIFKEGNK